MGKEAKGDKDTEIPKVRRKTTLQKQSTNNESGSDKNNY